MVTADTTRFTRMQQCLLTLLVALLLYPPLTEARVTASVDRNTISEQDIISLTIRSDTRSARERLDLSELEQSFEVLNSQQKNQVSITNGRRTANYDRIYVLAPKRSGTLTIPSFTLGGESTDPIQIKVTPGPQDPRSARSEVFLDSEVSRQEVYVQERFVYSLRIYHSVGLDNVSISPVEIENAMMIKPLGTQRKYETILEGVRYNVIEFKYSVIPERSGKLVIPEQTLVGIALPNRNDIFRTNSRRIRTKSPTQVINVLPIPDSYPADQPWLPTEQLTISDSWTDKNVKLRVGEPATRIISIKGKSLTAAQLPGIEFPGVDGVKIYPDQPVLDDNETAAGIHGERAISAAIVPGREGPLELPGFSVTWWNTQLNRLEKSVVPALRLSVLPAAQQAQSTLLPPIDFAAPVMDEAAPDRAVVAGLEFWQIISGLLALLWAATLWLWWRARQGQVAAPRDNPETAYKQRIETRYQAHKALQQASKAKDPAAARPALVAWFQAVFPERPINNLDDIRKTDCHPDLDRLILEIEQILYGDNTAAQSWQGEPLLAVLEQIRRAQKKEPVAPSEAILKPLYPM